MCSPTRYRRYGQTYQKKLHRRRLCNKRLWNRVAGEGKVVVVGIKNGMSDTYNLQPLDIVPIVIGATGVMKRNLQNYIKLLPCKLTSLELQIEVVRETVSMLKRALGCRLAT